TGVSSMKVLAALGAYQAEKNAYPDTLGELVPDYLTALPKDYFSKDGQFLYSKTETSFTLASSSPDLKTLDIEGDLSHYPRPVRPDPAKAQPSETQTPDASTSQ
ncbi:MAG: hypothetical protein KC800_23930, partial [Candidatus Eremiobacteraeota bacterium]|nr:hypothetical protein [Candidatus Eremiobacteraeota bacterium]